MVKNTYPQNTLSIMVHDVIYNNNKNSKNEKAKAKMLSTLTPCPLISDLGLTGLKEKNPAEFIRTTSDQRNNVVHQSVLYQKG